MIRVLWVDGRDGCSTVRVFLSLLDCTLKHGLNGKLYVMDILPQFGGWGEEHMVAGFLCSMDVKWLYP